MATCLMDWDDPEDPYGVPEDAMFYPVPSLSAEGGEVQFHGGIPFPGCPGDRPGLRGRSGGRRDRLAAWGGPFEVLF